MTLSATIVAQERRLLAVRFLNCLVTGGCLSQSWTEEQTKEASNEIVWAISSPKKNGQGWVKGTFSLESPRLGAWLRPDRGGTNRNIHDSLSLFVSQGSGKYISGSRPTYNLATRQHVQTCIAEYGHKK